MELCNVILPKKKTALVSLGCAAFMLCALPLLFRDAFFDINRFKVAAVCCVVPVLALLMGAARLKEGRCEGGPERGCRIAMLSLLASCVLACAVNGFTGAMLSGSDGRYCGLVFMLCCGVAFFMIDAGAENRRLLPVILACASAVALLGAANAMGLDPLGFYARLRKGTESTYLSTIGNTNFFGTYLVMLFPLAGALWIFSDGKRMRRFGLACAMAIAFGALFSRTDSALIGLHLACFALLALCGGDWMQLSRALALWALCALALSLVGAMLERSALHLALADLPRLLFDLHVCDMLAAVLALLAALCARRARRGARVPGKRCFAAAMLAFFGLCVLALLSVIVYFSVFNQEADLGSAAMMLRFDDKWGSYRGYAWIRTARAFSDYDPLRKLFGMGMETTLGVLTPYAENMAHILGAVYNDPHCQLLQMLLTCGALGMISFAALYACLLATFLRHAGDDPLLCGAFGSVFAYAVVLLINVTQPILIATYFSIAGLGLSALRHPREGTP